MVEELDLYEAHLSGRILIEVGCLTQLTGLVILDNQLSGSLPSELGLLTQFQHLDISNNQLTESMPSSLCPLCCHCDYCG